MIEVNNLTKKFGDKIAVQNLSFSLKPGRVTGFLGPNGSGKTTTMRCILGLESPTSGETLIDGVKYSDLKNPSSVVGAMIDAKSFHKSRSAYSHLQYICAAAGLPKKRVAEVLDITGLTKVAKKSAGGYSLGMAQRVGIAASLLGDPKVLILDEPVNGLDPEGVKWVRDLCREYASLGKTVFISSHLMSEVQLTVDDLIVIGRGQIIKTGTIEDIISSTSENIVQVNTTNNEIFENTLRANNLPYKVVPNPSAGVGYTILEVSNSNVAQVSSLVAQSGQTVLLLNEKTNSLEESFMKLTHDDVEYHAKLTGEMLTGEMPKTYEKDPANNNSNAQEVL